MREEIFDLVRRIPFGVVTSYGAVGRCLNRPVSGLLVGRALSTCPAEVPWWRVVARDGTFVIARKSPEAAFEQGRRLAEEGFAIHENGVEPQLLLDADALFLVTSGSD